MTREEALAQSPRIAIDTPSLKGSIALKGGRIDDLTLKDYRETVEPDEPECRAAVAGGRAAAPITPSMALSAAMRARISPFPPPTRCGRRRRKHRSRKARR